MLADLNLISAGAARGLILKLESSVWSARNVRVTGTFGAVGAMLERFRDGEACDLLVLTERQIQTLKEEGRVHASDVATIGKVRTGMAVPSAAERRLDGSADGLRNALLQASAIYIPDPHRATAGIHFMKVLRTLGIEKQVGARLRPYPNGAAAMQEMAAGNDPEALGCTQVPEILDTPGVKLLGPLPLGLGLETVYTAAVPVSAARAQLAREFMRSMTDSQASALRAECGFELA